ncbi:20338_t:CDS:2, partial [Racocetra persica]
MSNCEDWLQSVVKKCSIKKVPYTEFSNKKRIKRGGFGTVFKVKCESLGEVAIKEVADADTDEYNRKIFINEHTANILIHQGNIKISDFGFSRKLYSIMISKSKNFYGVIPFVDPQKLGNFEYVCDKESDVYSMGVLMWEISNNGCRPFALKNDSTLATYIIGGLRETPVSGTPIYYVKLYSDCWNDKPERRPSMEEVFLQLESNSSKLDPKSDQDFKENINNYDSKSDDIDNGISKITEITGSKKLELHIDSEIIEFGWLERAIANSEVNYFDHDKFVSKKKVNGTGFVYKYEWEASGLIVALKRLKLDIEKKE